MGHMKTYLFRKHDIGRKGLIEPIDCHQIKAKWTFVDKILTQLIVIKGRGTKFMIKGVRWDGGHLFRDQRWKVVRGQFRRAEIFKITPISREPSMTQLNGMRLNDGKRSFIFVKPTMFKIEQHLGPLEQVPATSM